MKPLFDFLASTAGRVVRAVAGAALILIGFVVAEGAVRWILFVIGLVPFLAGILDFCVFAPLLNMPFAGERLRHALRQK